MGLLSRFAGAVAAFTKSSTDKPENWFVEWAQGAPTSSGAHVTADSAMRTSAVWICVRIRSEDVGKTPCILYRADASGNKSRATEHPLYDLIRNHPNPMHTAMEFRQMLQAQIDLRGNGYAFKEFDARGQLIALWPLDGRRVIPYASPDRRVMFYRCQLIDGQEAMVPAEEILHVRGMTLDGLVGVSPITYHRETIGLSIAAEKYGAAFFGNNAQPLGGLEIAPVLGQEARDSLRASWKERHLGKRELAILDGGMKWVQTGMTNDDAQYIETRNISNRDIFRIYRVPPHKAGDLEQATFSNIEQQALEYVTDCLMSEFVRWEQTLRRDLLTDEERAGGYFFEHMVEALLRGDTKSRYEAYALARNWGVLSVNDIRDRENMNRIPNGDIYLQPLNMVEAGQKPPPVPAPVQVDPNALPDTNAPPPPPSKSGARALLTLAQMLVAREEQADA